LEAGWVFGKNLNPKDDVTASLPALFAEMFARFPGKNSEYWYLSDGGHFENTGVYPAKTAGKNDRCG
jgi:hypothetical protein